VGFQGEGPSSSQSLPLPMLRCMCSLVLTVVYGLEELQTKDDTRNRILSMSIFFQTVQLILSRIYFETLNSVFTPKVGLFTSSSYIHPATPN
jgi:hypothetical protein